MIRHCVLFKWNDEVDDAKRAAFLEGLAELLETHEAVRSYAHGADAAINAGNHDYAVTVDFDDEAGFVSYRDDAGHQAFIASRVRPILAERAAVQFEY
ncbi:MAG: Dabb family protein [bacterium]|nr:Dabb family protein [bacterium]MDE0667693.1 Dabb family protein [bacterium]MXZ30063.1 Dabb family protein [Acidimicrobiia bacterium]MYJ14367.1 Dabb family protein [Acidimicrobiia bacterium]